MIHSYPWYPSDWLNSETRLRLSLAARSVYRDLLDHCWMQGDLPTDHRVLAGLAGTSLAEFAKLWSHVSDRFIEVDGRLHHPKVDEKRPDLLKWREQKSNAGRASVAAKRQRTLEQPLNGRSNEKSVSFQPPSSSSSSSPSSSSSEKKPLSPLPATPSASTPIGLWVEKLRDLHPTPCEPRFIHEFCFNNWHRLGEDADKYEFFMETVYEGLEEHCRYWADDGNRFAMALDKWLNAGGWKKAPPERKTALTKQEAARLRQEAIDASWEIT